MRPDQQMTKEHCPDAAEIFDPRVKPARVFQAPGGAYVLGGNAVPNDAIVTVDLDGEVAVMSHDAFRNQYDVDNSFDISSLPCATDPTSEPAPTGVESDDGDDGDDGDAALGDDTNAGDGSDADFG